MKEIKIEESDGVEDKKHEIIISDSLNTHEIFEEFMERQKIKKKSWKQIKADYL